MIGVFDIVRELDLPLRACATFFAKSKVVESGPVEKDHSMSDLFRLVGQEVSNEQLRRCTSFLKEKYQCTVIEEAFVRSWVDHGSFLRIVKENYAKPPEEGKYIFIPYCVRYFGGRHMTLIVAKDKHVAFYCPLGRNASSYGIENTVKDIGRTLFNQEEVKFSQAHTRQQRDMNNCAIYVLELMRKLLERRTFQEATEEAIDHDAIVKRRIWWAKEVACSSASRSVPDFRHGNQWVMPEVPGDGKHGSYP